MSTDEVTAPGLRTIDRSRTRRRDNIILIVKIIILACTNALLVFGAYTASLQSQWGIVTFLVASLVIIDYVYFSRRTRASKYLLPGLLFLVVYQIFVIGYTGYIAFTNYGDGHNSNQDQAVEALLARSETRVPDSTARPATIVAHDGSLGLAVVDGDGTIHVGTAEQPLAETDGALNESGRVVEVEGYTVLSMAQVNARQDEVFNLRVPVSDDPNSGSLRTTDGFSAYAYRSTLVYDEQTETLTDAATGQTYVADHSRGNFVSDDGQVLSPGWRVPIGFDNFTSVLTDSSLRGPFMSVLLWTFVFAGLTTFLNFAFGLLLALLVHDARRMRGKKVYRSLLILPYAFPMFLSAFVWAGMMNRDFGFINEVLLNGATVPWLTDPLLAKISILIVNLWLGYPYMFLVTTGALQSIPDEVLEAARMDGAGWWRTLRTIRMPLLLVSVAPLLITTFAFNFNNFNVIYLLTGGGPTDLSASVSVGQTDILISFVYKLAFGDANRDYGLASAISILIFFIVGLVSIISFRRTRKLEEIH